jgi:serine/threonine-protein kinase
VVHRDIKPENVLLSERHALVTDFGVAKAVSEATGRQSLTTAGMALGTPAYMAPEQAAADPHADHRADIYAFGVVAYELLTGLPPFTGATPQAILAAQVTQPAEPVTRRRATIPAPLAALVMQCLEKKPADRPQSAEEVVVRLEGVLTPSGGMTPMEAANPARRRNLAIGVGLGVVALAVAAALAAWRPGGQTVRRSDGPTATAPKSIAVLPLANVGGDSTQDYYADGLSEELANALGKVRGLRVAARTSSFAFKGRKDLDVAEVGDKLHVGVVLQGTVRRLGDRVKLSVQLTDTRDRVELWSESYDQDVKDVFAIQDSITSAIVSQLALTLAPARPARAPSPEAHDLYLRGLALINSSGREDEVRQAMAYYRMALAKDPDYVEAWLGLAFGHGQLADMYVPPRIAYDSARFYALEALARDSLASQAHQSLAWAALALDRDYATAEKKFRRAIELSPNSAMAHVAYGGSMCFTRPEAGLVETDRGLELDRLSPFLSYARQSCLYFAHRYDEVIRQGAKTDSLGGFPYGDDLAAAAHRELGQYPEAVRRFERTQRQSGIPQAGLAITYAKMGRTAEARRILAQFAASAKERYVNPAIFAALHANLGESDLAFQWLERAVEERTTWILPLKLWPELEPIRSDPRFAALVQRLKIP